MQTFDPCFVASGTTLVQACELGMHSIGVDISRKRNYSNYPSFGKFVRENQKIAGIFSSPPYEKELIRLPRTTRLCLCIFLDLKEMIN